MKKLVVCFILIFMIFLSGCFRSYHIEAEPGSKWVSEEPFISFVITELKGGEGTVTINGETIDIECHFGPGKAELAVSELGEDCLDDYLFRGNYDYDNEAETITFTITEDNIGLNASEIIFRKE